MDIYGYVADNNPQACQDLCTKYGFQAQASNTQELGDCMIALCQEVGLPALQDLVALHPDKELILEQYTTPANAGMAQIPTCGCAKCKGAGPVAEQYLHGNKDNNFFHMNQAGMFIIGGLIVLTLAIVSTKN
jgi:hypothetical protein